MPITTVLGNVEKRVAGCILPHEHLLIDLRKLVDRPADENGAHFFESLGMSNRWRVYNDPYALLDNAVIEEEDTALKELLLFKQAGGDTVADVTLDDIGRNPSRAREAVAGKRREYRDGLRTLYRRRASREDKIAFRKGTCRGNDREPYGRRKRHGHQSGGDRRNRHERLYFRRGI